MSEHDPLCPSPLHILVVSGQCEFCKAIRAARADEDEKIAQAIEAEVGQWNPESFVDYRAGLRSAARIARGGR